ncbi:MAG: DUF7670 domain-containing protein [Bacteroidales bacterium]
MNKTLSILHWTPRIISILAILFVSMFALDAFAPGLSIWQQIGGFLIHLIPSFVLLTFLIISWKWEYVGGILFAIIGLGLSPFVFMLNYRMNHSIFQSLFVILVITIPFFVVGILFILSHFIKKKNIQISQTKLDQ